VSATRGIAEVASALPEGLAVRQALRSRAKLDERRLEGAELELLGLQEYGHLIEEQTETNASVAVPET
jgi:hypothetical protein